MATTLPQRKNLRHESYDYRSPGAYFVTICIEDGLPLLGRADENTIVLTDAGHMVTQVWHELPKTFSRIKLDLFVVMPNHIHFIIWLTAPLAVANESGAQNVDIEENARASLPEIIGWFKSLTTARYRHGVHVLHWPAFPKQLWQRSYYDHVVRSDAALHAIQSYIKSNPQRWFLDRYNSNSNGRDEEAVALWQLLQNDSSRA